jgi:hypothetical protein
VIQRVIPEEWNPQLRRFENLKIRVYFMFADYLTMMSVTQIM